MNYTKFTNVEAENVKGGTVFGELDDQRALNAQVLSMEDSATLSDAKRNSLVLQFSCSAASKSLTLGLADKQIMIVCNFGETNAVTVKARTGDTGTSIGTGKVALVIGSVTPNASKFYVLN